MEKKAKQLYESPAAEIFEVASEGAVIMVSGGNKSEKFTVGQNNQYDDDDFE